MTREQVEKEMAQYRTIFTVVRLLEAAQVGSDKTLRDYCKCYDFWHKHTQCQNCISAQVLRDHIQRTKLEYIGSQVFQVTAVYREVDGQPCVMELIQQLDSETLIDPENSDRLMDSVAGYHFKLYHDALTGCYNRNAYHEDTIRCKKLTNLLLFAFDLNNLKYYNDKFGHDCGDQYITDAVHILQKVFSRYGKLYRIGGDEFCVLIDDHNTCDISHLICCLRKEEAVYNASSRNIHLQIACGYAVFDSRTDADLDALQKRADQNMYENKKQLKTFSYR